MSSQWLPLLRKYSQDPLAARFNALSTQLAQYDAQQTQIESTDLPNAIQVDNSIIRYMESSQVFLKTTQTKFFLPLEPDLNHLTLWLKFDTWTNTINDASFFNNNGYILGGSPLGTNGPDKGFGTTIAFSFDGSQQNIDVLDNPATLAQVHTFGSFTVTGGTSGTGSFKPSSFTIASTSVGFSVACLVYPSTYSPTISGMFRFICSKVDDPDNMFVLYFDTGGLLHFWVYRSDVSYSVVTTSPITAQGWNWITATFDAQAKVSTLYVNGSVVTTSVDIPFERPGLNGDFAHATTDLYIGSNSGGDGFFKGFMSDFRYYHEKVLTPFEVQNLATNYYTTSAIPFGQILLIGSGVINPGTGPTSSSLLFNGLSTANGGNYVQINSPYTFTNQISVSAWVKFSNGEGGSYGGILGGINGYTANEFLLHSNGTLILWQLSTPTTVNCTANVSSFTNEWHHFSATYDGSNMNLYVDGVLRAGPTPQTGNLTVSNLMNTIALGGAGYVYHLGGNIREVAMYNVGLTSAEILSIYNNGALSVTRGAISLYEFNEGSGSIAHDIVGGRDGTLINSPVWQ